MSECEINPCVKQEYESELQPQPIPSQQFIQEYDSLDDINNPLPYTIYSVGDSKYYYENGEFVELCSGSGGGDSLTGWIELDKIQSLSTYLFDKYKNEDVTRIGYNAISGMLARVVYFPNATVALYNSISGGEILLMPKLQGVGINTAGDGSFSLGGGPYRKIIDLGYASFADFAQTYAVSNNKNIEKVILRSFSEPRSSNQFVNSSLATNGNGVYVYVPQNLLSQFQNSTKWAQWAKVLEFRTIEGSEFEDLDAYFDNL